eukprot:gene9421-19562_t
MRAEKNVLQDEILVLQMQLSEADALVHRIKNELQASIVTGFDTETERSRILRMCDDIEANPWIFDYNNCKSRASTMGLACRTGSSDGIGTGSGAIGRKLSIQLAKSKPSPATNKLKQPGPNGHGLVGLLPGRKQSPSIFDDMVIDRWKAKLFRSDGTVDRHLDLSICPETDRIEIHRLMIECIGNEENELNHKHKLEMQRVYQLLDEVRIEMNKRDAIIFDLRQVCEHNHIALESNEFTEELQRRFSAVDFDVMKRCMTESIRELTELCIPPVELQHGSSHAKPPPQMTLNEIMASKLKAQTYGHLLTNGAHEDFQEDDLQYVRHQSAVLPGGTDNNGLLGQGQGQGQGRGHRGAPEYFGNPGMLWKKIDTENKRQRALELKYKPLEDPAKNMPTAIVGEKVKVKSISFSSHNNASGPEHLPDVTQSNSNNASHPSATSRQEDKSTAQETKAQADNLRNLCREIRLRVLFSKGLDPLHRGPLSSSSSSHDILDQFPSGTRAKINSANGQINHHLHEARKLQDSLLSFMMTDEQQCIEAERYYANIASLSNSQDQIVELSQKFLEGSGSALAAKVHKNEELQNSLLVSSQSLRAIPTSHNIGQDHTSSTNHGREDSYKNTRPATASDVSHQQQLQLQQGTAQYDSSQNNSSSKIMDTRDFKSSNPIPFFKRAGYPPQRVGGQGTLGRVPYMRPRSGKI